MWKRLRVEVRRLDQPSRRVSRLRAASRIRVTGQRDRLGLVAESGVIFTRVTGFADLDETVARTHANKDELLLVLDRSDIPLHTNGSENDVRSFVTKRRIYGETRSAAGKQALDTFLSLLKTCSKLAISFWDYLGARLKIPDADRVPWLPHLIRQNAPV